MILYSYINREHYTTYLSAGTCYHTIRYSMMMHKIIRGEKSLSAQKNNMLTLPDWYRTERETEKIIEKLRSVKELDYYLRNPDEYIRRLAILRLYKLSDKDALSVLKDLLDDPMEIDENKYLGAWVIKSLSKKWASDIFISPRYLGRFTGNESFNDLFSITQEHSDPSVEFDFTSSSSHSTLTLDSAETSLEKDVFFETEFDFKQWYSSFGSKLLKAISVALCAIPTFIIKLPLLLGKALYSYFKKLSQNRADKKLIREQSRSEKITERAIKRTQKPERIKQSKPDKSSRPSKSSKPGKQNDTSYDYYNLRNNLYKKPGIFSRIKNGVKNGIFQFFYVLFFPIRFALKHKLAIFCMVILTYVLLAYTDYGRALTNKYMAVDLRVVQKGTIEKVKEYSLYAINEFNRITGIDEWKQNKVVDQSNSPDTLLTANVASTTGKLYTVTAKKGLNIREAPDPASDKVGENSLAFGSTVTYLSKSSEDKNDVTWFLVKAQDGRTGWVSTVYLKEEKVG